MRNGDRERQGGRAMRHGLLVLVAALLLPLAALLQAPQEGGAQSAAQDSLWTVGSTYNADTEVSTGNVGACASPAASLATCFGVPSSTVEGFFANAIIASSMATDGENVYLLGTRGALSCPVADLGTNCTWIMAGPWPLGDQATTSIAAYDGEIWIGQTNGSIWRCPADLPYAAQSTAPDECILFDDAGDRGVQSLLLANDTLYAGLAETSHGNYSQGLLWSCDPQTANACTNLDAPGDTNINSMSAGGGYLWAGLDNGIVWQCEPDLVNRCANWEQAGGGIASLSYDGAGTLYAAVEGSGGVIWSCSTAAANGCGNVLSNVDGMSVAAGAGGVFSSSGQYTDFFFDTSPFTAANAAGGASFQWSPLLYIPAGGPVGVGAAEVGVSVAAPATDADASGQRCKHGGKRTKATVTLTGPYGFEKTRRMPLCSLLKAPAHYSLLDPGEYRATVRTKGGFGEATFRVEQDRTQPVNVQLERTPKAQPATESAAAAR